MALAHCRSAQKYRETMSAWLCHKNGKPQKEIHKQIKYYNFKQTCLIKSDVRLQLRTANIQVLMGISVRIIWPAARGAVYHGKILILQWPEKERQTHTHSFSPPPPPLPPPSLLFIPLISWSSVRYWRVSVTSCSSNIFQPSLCLWHPYV